jgi:uncharacterized protein (DUF488 family)
VSTPTPVTHIYTIGFTQKTAQQFFDLLKHNAIDTLVDIRLKPDSQLSGFAKGRDLPYFLKALADCDYLHLPLLTPTEPLLKRYRDDHNWQHYATVFEKLLHERKVIETLDFAWWNTHRTCLLCSEHEPTYCHRRLVAEYLARHWQHIEIHHLQ